ncbi:hypothetical protein CIB48_g812 [Xylaria polymorpha]|nr:hypothetical protein CIB48_g812 [Xylaria polymorpha]
MHDLLPPPSHRLSATPAISHCLSPFLAIVLHVLLRSPASPVIPAQLRRLAPAFKPAPLLFSLLLDDGDSMVASPDAVDDPGNIAIPVAPTSYSPDMSRRNEFTGYATTGQNPATQPHQQHGQQHHQQQPQHGQHPTHQSHQPHAQHAQHQQQQHQHPQHQSQPQHHQQQHHTRLCRRLLISRRRLRHPPNSSLHLLRPLPSLLLEVVRDPHLDFKLLNNPTSQPIRSHTRLPPTPTPAAAAAPATTASAPMPATPVAAPTPIPAPSVAQQTPVPAPTPVSDSGDTPSQPPPVKKSRTNTPWTPAEELRLKQMRDAGNSWAEIAKTFPTRTEGSVKKHWYKDMHYAEFAENESQALLNAIKDYENNKWKTIGQKVGKPAKACEQYAKEHFPDLFATQKAR